MPALQKLRKKAGLAVADAVDVYFSVSGLTSEEFEGAKAAALRSGKAGAGEEDGIGGDAAASAAAEGVAAMSVSAAAADPAPSAAAAPAAGGKQAKGGKGAKAAPAAAAAAAEPEVYFPPTPSAAVEGLQGAIAGNHALISGILRMPLLPDIPAGESAPNVDCLFVSGKARAQRCLLHPAAC